MTRRVPAAIAAVVVTILTAGCASGDDETSDNPTSAATVSTEPPLTPPPTTTPEEQAEAEIIATFEGLIADRDDYYSNASSYTLAEVSTDSPVTGWRVTGEAELDMSNWTVSWRENEVDQSGLTLIQQHDLSNLEMSVDGASANSIACLDLGQHEFLTFDGESAELPYELDRFQTWTILWIRHDSPEPEAGIDDAGWYVRAVDVARNREC